MNRREFLRNAAIIAAGTIAVDQLELLERLAPRRLYPAWPTPPRLYGDGVHDDTRALQWLLDHRPGPNVVMPGGTFRISNTLYIANPGADIDGSCSRLLTSAIPEGRAALYVAAIESEPELPRHFHHWWFDSSDTRRGVGIRIETGRPVLSI